MTIWDQSRRERNESAWIHPGEQAETPELGSLNEALWAAQDRVNAERADILARIEELSKKLVDAHYRAETIWDDSDDQEFVRLMKVMADAHWAAGEQARREHSGQP